MENDAAMDILEEFSYGLNLKEFDSLNADELEANGLAGYSKLSVDETVTSPTEAIVNVRNNDSRTKKMKDLGDAFFKDEDEEVEEVDVKMEFTCESEKLIEQIFPKDLHQEDEETKLTDDSDSYLQEEVCSMEQSENDIDILAAAEQCGIDISNFNTKVNVDSSMDKTSVTMSDKEDDDDLSNIMNDHNYISQEIYNGDGIRQRLINHILRKINNNNQNLPKMANTAGIVNFVNSLMDRMNNFNFIESEHALTEADLFVQNIMDAVAAEDAADENDSVQEEIISQTSKNGKTSGLMKNAETNTSPISNIAKSPIFELPPPPPAPKSSTSTFDSDKQSLANDEMLPENCSEPLEHANFDMTFDAGGKTQSQSQTPVLPLLEDLSKFAKTLVEDCEYYRTDLSTTEEKLTDYIKRQFDNFKQLAKIHSIEREIQTESQYSKHISKRKSRKLINIKNKMTLLATSESDCCTDAELSSDVESDADISRIRADRKSQIEKKSHSVIITAAATAEALNSEYDRSLGNVYDDGVSLAKYIQSEIFETELYERSCSPSDNELAHSSTNEQINVSNERTEQPVKLNENEHDAAITTLSESDKENDKEIQRLINLKGLARRSTSHVTNMSTIKSTENTAIEKPKTKALTQKGKSDELLDFIDDHESDRESASDESVNESDKEITEQTYVKRYNEEFKMQLLNSSSSDLDDSEYENNSDTVDTDKLARNGEDADNDDSKGSPTLDKFLKNFDANADLESEDDDGDGDGDADTDEPNPTLKSVHITAGPTENVIETSNGECTKEEKFTDPAPQQTLSPNDLLETAEKKSNISTDNSDCELLNDNFNFRKRESKPKSLEKMFKDADKRKKTNSLLDDELISLSSASDCTDVEAVDAETDEATKSRMLKPMLRQDQLAGETRKAQKNEEERIRRLEKKQSQMAKALKEHANKHQKGDLILDFNEEKKTFIKVHPDIVKHMKKHQIEGVKFLYDSCYGGLEALKKSPGSGCILAHCMGLGKTLQLIALLHTVISYNELKTTKVLVLCPKSTVMNWADEIVRWIGPISTKNLKVYKFSDTSDINERLSVLKEWSQSSSSRAGCLLIGYEAFRRLVFFHSYKSRANTSSAALEDIRDKVVKYLLKPGADLVVCDEGHIIKNRKSAISLAVAEIVTPKRIILTGTPIQNNLKEYYSMVNFIKPLFLGTEKEFANLYANPIRNGQHKDSSKKDIKIMKQRSFVLHKKLSKFVQRKEAELLKSFLPQKFEYVLFIPLTEVQNNLYEYILSAIPQREENRGRGLITDYTCLRKIWTHPKVLENAWKNAINQKYKRDLRKNPNSDDDQPDDIYDSQTGVMSVTNDWWRHLVTDQDLESILPSNKLRTMFEIIRMCSEKDEKCLIFSAFVAVLNVVEYFFKKITNEDPEIMKELNLTNNNRAKNTWISGKDYYRLDGKTSKSIRHEMVQRFNAPENKRARVFLISAKAGGQGINLTGANRVLILDTSWNPSNDQQNIFRIFRLGQKRNCYIYRLLAMGTMEEKVYSRSVTKQAMSFRVVDEQQIDRHYSMAELTELYTLTKPDYKQREVPVLPQDSVLISLLRNFPQLVYKYHEHDSLLENKVEQELSEQEKADAWNAYERDLQLSTELRELPNLEALQQNFGNPKMLNFMGTYPGPDMSTLFNYGMGQQTPAPPNTMPTSHYNPYNPFSAASPSYMDMLSLYRKYTQQSFAYPEISKSLRDNFNPNIFSTTPQLPQPPQSALLGAGAVPPPSSASVPTNPLSALGDMSIYPLGLTKSLQPPPSNSGIGVGGSGASGMLPAHLTASSTFDQYSKVLSAYQSFYSNYTGDYPSTSSVAASAAVAAASVAKNKYNTSQFLPPAPLSSAPPPYQPQPQPQPLPQPQAPPPPMSMQQQTPVKSTPNINNSNNTNNNNHNQPSSRGEGGSSRTDGTYQSSKMPSHLLPTTTTPQLPTPTQTSMPQPPTTHTTNAESTSSKLSKLPAKMASTPPPPLALPAANPVVSNVKTSNLTTTMKLASPPQLAPTNRAINTTNQAPSPAQSVNKSAGGATTAAPPVTKNSSAPQSIAQQQQQQFSTKSPLPNKPSQVPPPSNASASKLLVAQKRMQTMGKSASPVPSLTGLTRPALKATTTAASTTAATPTLPTTTATSHNTTIATNQRSAQHNVASASKSKISTSASIGSAMTITSTPTTPTNNNMGIVYPTGTVQRINKADVQIIPTTAQNTSGINSSLTSKPFGDISPSISLTALRNTTPIATTANNNNNNNINTNTNNKSQAIIKSNNIKSNINKPNAQTPSPVTLNVSKLFKKLPPNVAASNRSLASSSSSSSLSNSTTAPATGNASASVKAAAANAVLAKVNSPASFQSYYKNVDTKQQSRASPITSVQTAATAAAAAIKRNSLHGNINSSSSSSNSNNNPIVRRVKDASGIRSNSPLTTNTGPTANSAGGSGFTLSGGTNLKIVPKTVNHNTVSNSSSGNNNSGLTLQKRFSSASSSATATPTSAVAAAAAAAAATATTTNNANKNALNIRPIDGKQNAGVYIIETNINEKRVAIGAATKSGGGTTVTKVLTGIKRKAPETHPRTQSPHANPTTAAFSSDPKRVKVATTSGTRMK